jgi:dTDP-4-amino-4,6-dideoxygalactose transaminase
MRLNFLPFAKPSISQEAIEEVVACLGSGWITTGPRVQAFEKSLKHYFQDGLEVEGTSRAGRDNLEQGEIFVQSCSSATAGLFLALKALDLQPGDEVITTPLTFVATLNVIVQAGCVPVLVDIDPMTYNMDLAQVEKAITSKTRVLMPVHFAGLALDMEVLYGLGEKYGLRILEDAAHAMGSRTKDARLIGSFGDIQVFSFHPNKNMTTGEGGCIVSRDSGLARAIEVARFHGIDRCSWDRFSKSGSQQYDVIEPGYKFNMMDLQAALGMHQLAALPGFIEARRHKAQWYYEHLKQLNFLVMPPAGAGHSYHLFAPLVRQEIIGRDRLMEELKGRNIGSGLHYASCHLFDYYRKKFGWKEGDFPWAEDVSSRILSLPLFPDLSEEDLKDVLEALKDIGEKVVGCV